MFFKNGHVLQSHPILIRLICLFTLYSNYIGEMLNLYNRLEECSQTQWILLLLLNRRDYNFFKAMPIHSRGHASLSVS